MIEKFNFVSDENSRIIIIHCPDKEQLMNQHNLKLSTI